MVGGGGKCFGREQKKRVGRVKRTYGRGGHGCGLSELSKLF